MFFCLRWHFQLKVKAVSLMLFCFYQYYYQLELLFNTPVLKFYKQLQY